MAVMIKCKMCGGDLVLAEGSTVATCEYCGTIQTVPTMDHEKKIVQFERAERLRRNCDFDKAAGVYESIVADFRQEAEAYWGLVLCKYGIEYVDDPDSGRKVPTCHRSSFDSVMEDPNFDLTMENADAVSLPVYRTEAKQIEDIRKGILEVSAKEYPYDVFICYKETDASGDRTVDSLIAQDIYDALTEKGYRVFFSRVTLEDKLGIAYEPYIFAALNSAKVMLAVGTAYEHYNAVWVKNEWSRFLKLMEQDKSRWLIPCFKGIDAYDIPREFKHLQAQDMGKVGAIQDLLRGVDKILAAKPGVQTAQVSDEDMNRSFLYNSAVEAAQNGKPKEIQEAIKKLEALGNWKDAPAQLAAAKKSLKKAKAKKRNKVILILGVIAALIVGFLLYADYNGKMIIYNQGKYYEEQYDYKLAIAEYKRLDGFKDSEDRLASLEQQYSATEDALMTLLNGTETGENCFTYYQIDGTTAKVLISMEWHKWQNYVGEVTPYYSAYFMLVEDPEHDDDLFEAFFGKAYTDPFMARYDTATQEYLFINHLSYVISFRGKLNDDGSLTVYNDAGTTYKLLPTSFGS